MEKYKHKTIKGRYLEIEQTECPESPREWDNATKMIFSHKRYTLGDEADKVNSEDFANWDEQRDYLKEKYNTDHIYPVYMFDHSGVSISLAPFSCPWDSGQIGFVLIDGETIEAENLSDKQIGSIIKGEIETYNQYLTGAVYSFMIYDEITCGCCGHTSNEIIDSCSGFYGYDMKTNGMSDHIKDISQYEQIEV